MPASTLVRLSSWYAGASFREKLTTGGLVLGAGSAYALWAHLPLQQALNGLLAALMFNIIYDVLLSQVGCPSLPGNDYCSFVLGTGIQASLCLGSIPCSELPQLMLR